MSLKSEVVVQLDEDDIQELAALAENASKLPALMSESSKISPTIGTVQVSKSLSKIISLDQNAVLLMVNGLVHAFRIRDDMSVTSEETAQVIVRSLKKADQSDLIKAWKSAEAKIIEAMNVITAEHPLVVCSKAGLEAGSLPNIVLSIGMSTGTRPVFNEEKTKILFTIVSHTLTLDYHEGYRRHKEISLHLDAGDISMLRIFCDEAEQAAATLKASISGPSAVPWETEDDVENEEQGSD
jgi:hypothetical protein